MNNFKLNRRYPCPQKSRGHSNGQEAIPNVEGMKQRDTHTLLLVVSLAISTKKYFLALLTKAEQMHNLGPCNSPPRYILNKNIYIFSPKDM